MGKLDGANAAELTKKVKALSSQSGVPVSEPSKPVKEVYYL